MLAFAVGAGLPLAGSTAAQSPRTRVVNEPVCASPLETGVRTRRMFCDVMAAVLPEQSITITIPPRDGGATLYFDLHNRFDLPARDETVRYARHLAVVRVVDESGALIDRAAVLREFRSEADLFDRLSGGARPDGVKGVAPGPPEAIRVTIPPGPSVIGIVGEGLEVRGADGRDEHYDAPGRPVAIASNIRLEYTPR